TLGRFDGLKVLHRCGYKILRTRGRVILLTIRGFTRDVASPVDHPPAVTPRLRHRQKTGGRREAPPGRPGAGPARLGPGYAGHGVPAAAAGTRAAVPAPGAACGRGPPAPLTRGLTAGGSAPGSALGAPALAGRAAPPRRSLPGPQRLQRC